MNSLFAAAAPTPSWSVCHRNVPRPPARPRSCCIVNTSLYDVLGVTSSASTSEIRSAYRRLAARYHPDVNSSRVAHDTFQALNLAAEVLTSDSLREEYDSQGTAALPGSRYRSLLDFLKQARSQGVSAVLGEPGGELSTVLGLAFNEAVTGSAATVTLDVLGPCPDCQGSGFDALTTAVDCRVCRGSGEIMVRHWSPESSSSDSDGSSSSSSAGIGMLTIPRSCPACRGSGRDDQQHCQQCEGEGRVQLRRKVRFRVPAGVADGQVLRVKGQGHSGKYGGAPGDLLVKLQVYDLADVQRRGDDLHSVLELTIYDALLGGSVPVRTVRGHRHIMVPAGVQHGQLLCVQGAGVPRSSRGGVEYGHHYFEVSVRVPSAAAASQAELLLLQRLAAAVQQQPNQRDRPGRQQQQQEDGSSMEQLSSDGVQQPYRGAAAASQQRGDQQDSQQQRQQRPKQQQPAATAGRSQHTSDPPEDPFG